MNLDPCQVRCDDCEEGSGNAVEEIQIEFSARIRRLEMSLGLRDLTTKLGFELGVL